MTVLNARWVPTDLALDRFDGVIVGGSIVVGNHQKEVRQFVTKSKPALEQRPSAFFSVSGSAGGKAPDQQADAQRMLQDFLDETRWQPTITATFGGSIAYTKYNLFLKFMMRRISTGAGGSGDLSRDHEYTDWEKVATFADEFEEKLGS